MAEATKIPVVAIGYQDFPDGFRKLLVNEPSGSTHVYDPERHIISKPCLGLEGGDHESGLAKGR